MSQDLAVDGKVVSPAYHQLRETLSHQAELEGSNLKGGIKLAGTYVDGRRKGKRGRAVSGNTALFSLLAQKRCACAKVVKSVSAEEIRRHIQAKTRKSPVNYTNALRGYESLKQDEKHHNIP